MSTDTTEAQHITCTDDMKKLHITCTEEVDTVCACCGKEGSDLNICNKCQMVKYCNAACKRKHRTKHKKKCERRAAEIKAELHEEQLFKQPPLKEDCPICMLPLPSLHTGAKYYSCCGKEICSGCVFAVRLRNLDEQKCPFCRTPAPKSDEEIVRRLKKRMEVGDAEAIYIIGSNYSDGSGGLPRNRAKALKLWHKAAAELGCAEAYYNIGIAYYSGEGVERDEKKADHYFEQAAMGGVVPARHNLGNSECRAGNCDRALKHWLISAGGDNNSVKIIQHLYKGGKATREDYARALQAYQTYLGEIRSEQRDHAAAFSDDYKYY